MVNIDRHTQLCISLAARPGNFGNGFHNFLYEKYRLNFIYKSHATSDLRSALIGVKALNIRGCSLSMPFKQEACLLVDDFGDEVTREIGAINTLVNDNGRLLGYNTDYEGFLALLQSHQVDRKEPTVLFGSGGVAAAIAFALRAYGQESVTVVSRRRELAARLAQRTGYRSADLDAHEPHGILINATPLGMVPHVEQTPFGDLPLRTANLVFDVVTNPICPLLAQKCQSLNIPYVSGFALTVEQGQRQFAYYTGITPQPTDVVRAAEFALGVMG